MCSAVHFGVLQYTLVQCIAVHCSIVYCNAMQCSILKCGVVQYSSAAISPGPINVLSFPSVPARLRLEENYYIGKGKYFGQQKGSYSLFSQINALGLLMYLFHSLL